MTTLEQRMIAAVQRRLNDEAAFHSPPEALYAASPGQLLDHVHHRIAKLAAQEVIEVQRLTQRVSGIGDNDSTNWRVLCEHCRWSKSPLESRGEAIAEGQQHVQDEHRDDEEWAFRVQGIRLVDPIAGELNPHRQPCGHHAPDGRSDICARCDWPKGEHADDEQEA